MSSGLLSAESRPILSMAAEARTFGADWSHCDQLSNYIATALSLGRPDPLLYANLLSTILNEVYEALFRRELGQGEIDCTLFNEGEELLIVFDFEAKDADREHFDSVVRRASSADAARCYEEALASGADDSSELGLLGLAVDYGCGLRLERSGERLRLGLRLHQSLQLAGMK